MVSHQVQRHGANRNFGSGRRQRRGAADPRPAFAPAPPQPAGGAGWPLAAVRADQAADTTDSATIQLISDITRGVDEALGAALQRNAAAALEGLLSGGANELKQKVQASVLDLQSGLLERETEVGGGGRAARLW